MIRKRWHYDAKGAADYFRTSDYYTPTAGEWFGRDAERLGLTGAAAWEDFEHVLNNRDPRDPAKSLTRFSRDGRRVALELNFNAVKDASIAGALAGEGNQGDPFVARCHDEAVKYTLGLIELDMQVRDREDGKGDGRDNRATGRTLAWRTRHGETRINEGDLTPDPNLHDHVLIMNASWDQAAKGGRGAFKAIETDCIVRKLPYYEAVYHNRMAWLLRTEGGYGIQRDGKAYGIVGVSKELKSMFSRRTATIMREKKKIEEKLGIEMSPEAAGQLGAKTRLGKTDLTQADLHAVWVGKLSDDQRRQLAGLKGQASEGPTAEQAVRYAVGHEFYRHSVVPVTKLHETALRRGMGWVTEEDIARECRRQNVLVKDGEATTREVWAEETRILDYAKRRGSMPALAPKASVAEVVARTGVKLSSEQEAVCRDIWQSTDPVLMIEGDAGTGKTQTMQATIPGIDKPGVFLAPSGSASRGTLREKGFTNANTIAMFKADARFREQAKGGFVYIDEAPLAALSDIAYVFDWAKKNQAKVILQGDRKQHKSPQRGNLFEILDKFAGLPVARLTENFRQLHDGYKQAVNKIARGDIVGGHRALAALGWVKQVAPEDLAKAMAAECLGYLEAKESFVAVGITHKQNDAITAELREMLRERGRIGKEETPIERLVQLDWSPPQKLDFGGYDGSEVVRFFHDTGEFKAGQRVGVAELKASRRPVDPEHFVVYAKGELSVSTGDVLRATAGGKTKDGKRIDNGDKLVFQRFTDDGDLVLKRGKSEIVVGRDFRHWNHGLVDTSFKAQGETRARVVGAFTDANWAGINAETAYVLLSRGRLSAKLYSTLDPAELEKLIQRKNERKSATELMGQWPGSARRHRAQEFARRLQRDFGRLRERIKEAIDRQSIPEREHRHAGIRR
jgi:conjugative relaxase-like TrwC/TraI family protein